MSDTNELPPQTQEQLHVCNGYSDNNINMVLGAILCGRCVCGERLRFYEGEIYKGLSDSRLDILVDDINTWLDTNKQRIKEAIDEYYYVAYNRDYWQDDVYKFRDRYTNEPITLKFDVAGLVDEFRTVIPILVKIKDECETCHIICMLRELQHL
jgi:hypothetical protein